MGLKRVSDRIYYLPADEETDRPILGYIRRDKYSMAVDSVLIYIPEEKTIFVGDADCEDYYDNGGKYNKYKLKNYIELIKGFDFHIYMIGHGEPENKESILNYLENELKNIK
ncbi:hypothetical protein [Tissierella praeacuta]|uniref:hypothetical protein n=1 Tax=Tissierella praeacuta TaxID=43131 RepID=UPI003341948A